MEIILNILLANKILDVDYIMSGNNVVRHIKKMPKVNCPFTSESREEFHKNH